MRKTLATAVAAGAIALGAPIAHAYPATAECGFESIAQETVTGGENTYVGVLYGVVVPGEAGNAVSVRCVVRVNGAAVADTGDPVVTYPVAVAAGYVSYTATDSDDVDLCVQWTDGSDSGETCGDQTSPQIPPQSVIDLLIAVSEAIDDILIPLRESLVDPPLCAVLTTLGNTVPDVPGVLEINGQGDVFLLGFPFWDCPPYDLGG